jgi:hypothetical protein
MRALSNVVRARNWCSIHEFVVIERANEVTPASPVAARKRMVAACTISAFRLICRCLFFGNSCV